jgi:hypothetical protein
MKTRKTELNSKRQYRCFFSETGPNGHPTDHTIQSIIKYSEEDDYEWAHALVDQLDNVLDLSINESMIFYPNRDDKSIYKDVAIIKRIR